MGYRAVLLPLSRHPLLDSGVHAVQKGCVGIGWNSGHLFRAPPYTADGRRGLSVRVVCSRDQTVKRTLVLLMINQNSTPPPFRSMRKKRKSSMRRVNMILVSMRSLYSQQIRYGYFSWFLGLFVLWIKKKSKYIRVMALKAEDKYMVDGSMTRSVFDKGFHFSLGLRLPTCSQ